MACASAAIFLMVSVRLIRACRARGSCFACLWRSFFADLINLPDRLGAVVPAFIRERAWNKSELVRFAVQIDLVHAARLVRNPDFPGSPLACLFEPMLFDGLFPA